MASDVDEDIFQDSFQSPQLESMGENTLEAFCQDFSTIKQDTDGSDRATPTAKQTTAAQNRQLLTSGEKILPADSPPGFVPAKLLLEQKSKSTPKQESKQPLAAASPKNIQDGDKPREILPVKTPAKIDGKTGFTAKNGAKNYDSPAKSSCETGLPNENDDVSSEINKDKSGEDKNISNANIANSDPARCIEKITDKKMDEAFPEEKLELSEWGLPEALLYQYAEKGISKLFRWQVECLLTGQVSCGGNLVYSAPTSAGKTLVAEILLIKRVLETGRKGLLILPFVSLAREKMFHLQSVLSDTGLRVEGFMGSLSPAGGWKVTDIAVATIEKANSLINRLLEDGDLGSICCVVVDELHMLGDQSRGYLLELLLTKVRFASTKPVSADMEDDRSVQIIGMSATLPNLSDLANWLNADLYITDYRPVPLTELIKVGNSLLSTEMLPVRAIQPIVSIPGDVDHLTWLTLETILASHSVLIFCPIKAWVEKLSETLAKDFYLLGRPSPGDRDTDSCTVRERLQSELNGDKLCEVLEQLKRSPAGLDSTLASTLRFGVAFHHAGLTTDERDIVEGNFKSGVIRVLVATSTLSSGVNLPARRVILRCPLTFNGQLMDKLAYKQMVGRAGRKGVDTEGESILLCKESEKARVRELVSGETEAVVSCLAGGGSKQLAASMKRAMLEVIVSGAATNREEVERYANCTLLAAQLKRQDEESANQEVVVECVDFLEKNEFIRLQEQQEGEGANNAKVSVVKYVTTRLGLACLASSLAPDEGLTVFAELQKARRQFVLENELHIIYLIVPIYAAVSWPKLDWMSFLTMWEELSPDMKRVGYLVGVEDRWIVRAMRGTLRLTDAGQRASLAVHQRFYTALALHDLVHEVPLSTVAAKYGATKGMLQSLQQAAATFAGMVTVFCAKLGWTSLELLVGQFQDRLEFGVTRELIDLCRLSSVDGPRARILFNGGLETVASVAASTREHVENLLFAAGPFASRKNEGQQRSKAIRTVFITGLPPMTEAEAARVIVNEARAVLKRDFGLKSGAWADSSATSQQTPTGSSRKRRGSSGKRRRNHRSSGGSGKKKDHLGTSPHLAYHLKNKRPDKSKEVGNTSAKSHEMEIIDKSLDQSASGKKKNSLSSTLPSDINKSLTDAKEVQSPSGLTEKSQADENDGEQVAILDSTDPTTVRSNNPCIAIDLADDNEVVDEGLNDNISESIFSTPFEDLASQKDRAPRRRSSAITLNVSSAGGAADGSFNLCTVSTAEAFDMSSIVENIFAEESFLDDDLNAGLTEGLEAEKEKSAVMTVSNEDLFTSSRGGSLLDSSQVSQPCDVTTEASSLSLRLSLSSEDEVKMPESTSSKDVEETADTATKSEHVNTRHRSMSNDDMFTESFTESFLMKAIDACDVKEANNKVVLPRSSSLIDGQMALKQSERKDEEVDRKILRESSNIPQIQTSNVGNPVTNRTDKTGQKHQPQRPGGLKRRRDEVKFSRRKKVAAAAHVSPGNLILSDSDHDLSSPGPVGTPAKLVKLETTEDPAAGRISRTPDTLTFDFWNDSKSDGSNGGGCSIQMLDVSRDTTTFKTFRSRLASSSSCAVAIIVTREEGNVAPECKVETGVIGGVVFCPSGMEVLYLPLSADCNESDRQGFISLQDRLKLLKDIVTGTLFQESRFEFRSLCWRGQANLLYTVTGVTGIGSVVGDGGEKGSAGVSNSYIPVDPCAAAWLLDPSSGVPSLLSLVKECEGLSWCELMLANLDLSFQPGGSMSSCPSVVSSSGQSSLKVAAVEAVLINAVWDKQKEMLLKRDLLKHFLEVEMPIEKVLLGMELSGMGINQLEYEDTRLVLEARCRVIEETAYRLAGRKFSLSSPSEVCRVLYQDLRLSTNGRPKPTQQELKSGRTTNRGGNVKYTADKETLERLGKEHELPRLILEYRRLTSALSKTVAPLLRVCVPHPKFNIPRVYPSCITHMATGRILCVEPNLQNVPKDFQLELTEDLRVRALGRRAMRSKRRADISHNSSLGHLANLLEPSAPSATVSLRNALVPNEGNVFISADYSQLELRILAHLSGDEVLRNILSSGEDVFVSLAARINQCSSEEVTDEKRQQAKQVVYGLVYGMGDRALGEQMGVDEKEAARFVEAFKNKYPGVRAFLNRCVADARRLGYIQTMSGRRRAIPDIRSTNQYKRAAAERQAVNTRVQGSASDLVKTAMVNVDTHIHEIWPHRRPVKFTRSRHDWEESKSKSGAWLVLQLHDELIYEVASEDVVQAALVIKTWMENSVKLSIPTPVRIKVGETWGSLQVLNL